MNLLSFKDLRRKLGGRSRSSVYRDVGLGRLPAPVKIGSRLYWNETEVEIAVDTHRIQGRAAAVKPS